MTVPPSRHPSSSTAKLVRSIFCFSVILLLTILPSITITGRAAPLEADPFGPGAPLDATSSADDLDAPIGFSDPVGYTITGLQKPNGLAVNPYTNRLYVTSRDNSSVLMIDTTNMQMLKKTTVGASPWGVAVNPVTNKVYVANFTAGTLSVLDGTTLDLLTTISFTGTGTNASRPTFVAAMPNSNLIVVVLYGWQEFALIDGTQDKIVLIVAPEGRGPWGLAVDDKRHRVFVSFRDSGTVEAFDQYPHWSSPAHSAVSPCGATPYGIPYALAFNSSNDQLYVACAHQDGNVDTAVVYSVLDDGVPKEISRAALDSGGSNGGGGVAVNTGSGNAFFTNSLSGTVSVIGGPSNRVIARLPTGVDPFAIAVDSMKGQVYVGDRAGNRIFVFADALDTTGSCQKSTEFVLAGNFAAGYKPFSVTAGDFNRDGKLDLAAANNGDAAGHLGDVSVLLGNGDGTFKPAVNYGAGHHPISIITADLNLDGKLDLVVANSGDTFGSRGTVSVLLGKGDGTFQEALNFNAGLGSQSVAAGDFNRDGKPDLVVANSYYFEGGNDVSVMLGNGNGTLQAAVSYAAGTQPTAVAVGDFNRDLKLDIAVTNFYDNNVSVLLGNGNGTFLPAANFGVGSVPYGNPTSLAVGDLNGDGKLDLAVANVFFEQVSVLLGNGDGTFQSRMNFYNSGGAPHSIALGDFNRDAKPDVALADSGFPTGFGRVSVLPGKGDGTFQNSSLDYRPAANPVSVFVGDFNRDGRPDLATANSGADSVSVLLNRCKPTAFLPIVK